MISTKFRFVKFVFSKKATKIDEIFTVDMTLNNYICNVKSTVKISSNFVAFLENMDFNSTRKTDISSSKD